MGRKRPYNNQKSFFSSSPQLWGKWGVIVIILVIFLLGISLVRNLFKIYEAKRRIKEEAVKLERLEAENQKIKDEIEKVKQQEYVEKQIRDKLGLVKEGELIVVLPDEETLRKLAPQEEKEEEALPDPVWKKWLKLFY